MATFPSSSSAFGVWRMLDVRDAVMGDNWPTTSPISSILVGNGVSFAGGTATASSSIDAGRQPSAAFDGVNGNEDYCWHSTSFNSNQWIQYNFGSGVTKTITAYWLMSRPTNDWYPYTWTFEGSNNGTSFVTLDTKATQSMPVPNSGVTNTQDGNFVKYTIANTTAYQYYRLNVTQAAGSSSYCVLGEMALLGY